MSTYDKLVSILNVHFKVPTTDITGDITFEKLDMDSLFIAELLVVIEDEIGVQLEDKDIEPSTSLTSVADLVDSRLGSAAGKPS